MKKGGLSVYRKLNKHTHCRFIMCDVCKRKCPRVAKPNENRCASIMNLNSIDCGPDSRHCYDTYFWTEGGIPSIYSEYGSVCDRCIDKLVDADVVVLDEEDDEYYEDGEDYY